MRAAQSFSQLLLLVGALRERKTRAGSLLAYELLVAQTVSFSAGIIGPFYRPNALGFNPQLGAGFMTLETFLSLTLLLSCVGGEERLTWLLCRAKT